MVMVTTEDEVNAAVLRKPAEGVGSAGNDALADCLAELAAVLDRAAGLGCGGVSEAQL
ncbi:MAG: hypothetical protein QOK30_2414, partial [Nocardioidaceae bacterium]|nr:hypothetical protein [Nocardioidaceae bacterium]